MKNLQVSSSLSNFKRVPEHYPDLATLDVGVAEVAEATYAPRTRSIYKIYYEKFKGFCQHYRLGLMPASSKTVTRFLNFMIKKGYAVKTVQCARQAIRYYQNRNKQLDPTLSACVSAQTSGHARLRGTRPVQKRAIIGTEIRLICLSLDRVGGVAAMRNKAALLLTFGGALRVSELCALIRSDITITPEGIVILIRRSKTDQCGESYTKMVVAGRSPVTDPVRAMHDWLSWYNQAVGASVPGDAPLFPALGRWGDPANFDAHLVRKGDRLRPMSPDCARGWLKKAAVEALPTVTADQIGVHSLRAGHATTAALNDAPRASIAAQGPWRKAETMDRYIRASKLARDSSSNFLGL